ncbi:MAG TPA: HAMP domain-containing sensor histidine kinase, partial [Flavobacteriaceae bacterium]|nr:HAMP domain-containing sensor histidine kinase [Flavobacteriaceae bacterium]
YDASGYSKMYFLSNILIAIFIIISVIVILVSIYLSNKISRPITTLAENLIRYDLTSEYVVALKPDTSSHELEYLTRRFNDLLKRTKEAFAFQKNAIQHISHELKTPVTILVSELERLNNFENIDDLKLALDGQINKAKSLGEIVNVLLEISKVESGQPLVKNKLRIDEVLFDLIDELNGVYPDFTFELNYFPSEFEESVLTIEANKMLIKQAFQNLLINSISYGSEDKAQIKLDCSVKNELTISISNFGETLSNEEEKQLFHHSFRGKNSAKTMGFGLGLVLAKKIILFHSGKIIYSNPSPNLNVFKVKFPLK